MPDSKSDLDIWFPEQDAPEGVWLITRYEGDDGFYVSRLHIHPTGEREWIDSGGPSSLTDPDFGPVICWQHGQMN